MAKKQRNILDFRNSSQRLFIILLVISSLTMVITLLSNPNSSGLTVALVFLPFIIISAIGTFASKKMLDVIDDRNKAIKKSNTIHRCQVAIIVFLLLFLILLTLAILAYFFLFYAQDKFGDNRVYKITGVEGLPDSTFQPSSYIKQQLVLGIVQVALAGVVAMVFLVFYMKIVITSDIARKDFSNLPKNIPAKKTVEKSKKELVTDPTIDYDDSDEYDL